MADPTILINAYVAMSTSTGSTTYVELPGVKTVRIPLTHADLNDAVMGDTLDAKYPGVPAAPVNIECRQDFTTGAMTASAGLDLRVHTFQMARTAFRLKIRPADAAVSGPNPSRVYSKVRFHGSSPIDGAYGEILVNKISIMPQSGCTLTRSTST
jgi:hypothetical protein